MSPTPTLYMEAKFIVTKSHHNPEAFVPAYEGHPLLLRKCPGSCLWHYRKMTLLSLSKYSTSERAYAGGDGKLGLTSEWPDESVGLAESKHFVATACFSFACLCYGSLHEKLTPPPNRT